ncbi:MAG TPA: hypothetical protein VMI10_21190 [Terriglobales bacterium]|nr:hypothetical protein [Terriglobales bacterium]
MRDRFLANRTTWVLIGLPIGTFAAYVAWLVVPAVVMKVVPAVVKAVFGA